MPSNVKPTTRECVHLVMRGHFRSRDKDGGHTIQCAVENRKTEKWKTVCCRQTSWLCFTEPELLLIEVLHCGNRYFLPFLLLWPWTWPDDLHLWTWSVSPGDIPYVQKWASYVKAFDSYRITVCECVNLAARGHFWSCDIRWRSHHSICHSRKPHDTRRPRGYLLQNLSYGQSKLCIGE